MAVAEVGAGARAEIMAKVGAGAENNFGSATLKPMDIKCSPSYTICLFFSFFKCEFLFMF